MNDLYVHRHHITKQSEKKSTRREKAFMVVVSLPRMELYNYPRSNSMTVRFTILSASERATKAKKVSQLWLSPFREENAKQLLLRGEKRRVSKISFHVWRSLLFTTWGVSRLQIGSLWGRNRPFSKIWNSELARFTWLLGSEYNDSDQGKIGSFHFYHGLFFLSENVNILEKSGSRPLGELSSNNFWDKVGGN